MSSRLSIRGASSTSVSIDTSKAQRDEVNKIQQDINIMTQKIAEMKGEPVQLESTDSSSASPFVVGIRALADSEKKFKDVKDLKISTLEKLLEKVGEFDRLLLKETAPVVDPTQVPLRRKSFGQDLYYLPTHLHLTARLMDLHATSKRVTVIKIGEGSGSGSGSTGPPPANPADKKALDTLKQTVSTQAKQLSDLEAKRIHGEEENAQLKRANEELKSQLQVQQTQLQALQAQQAKQPHPPAAAAAAPRPTPTPTVAAPTVNTDALVAETATLKSQCSNLTAEISSLKAQLAEQTHQVSVLHERVEVESGVVQSIVSVILGKANRINSNIELDGKGDDCLNLPGEVRNAFGILERAVTSRLSGLKAELSLIMSIKDLLEGELSTAQLQKDILQRDLVTLTEQNEALKTAYDSLSYEAARLQSTQAQSQNNDNDAAAEALVDVARLTAALQQRDDDREALLAEFREAQATILALQKWQVRATEAEGKLASAITDKMRAETAATAAKEEVTHYKKLTETLKQKLRDLGGNTNDKEFLDSFEEVMKEEMMTMKAAFESKLRLAREEADATSKKHQQEIIRMNAASPYASMARLGGAASSGSLSLAGGGGVTGGGASGASGAKTGGVGGNGSGGVGSAKRY